MSVSKNLLTKILTASILTCVAFAGQAGTITEQYTVKQEKVMIVIAPKSGLPKASCKFFNTKGERVAAQNVTVVGSFDDITIVEGNFYYEQHNVITSVKCK